jgi:thiamine biosynthesis protein ThiC
VPDLSVGPDLGSIRGAMIEASPLPLGTSKRIRDKKG